MAGPARAASPDTPSRFRSAPTLETERLTLRAFVHGDLDAVAAILGSIDVMRHIGGVPLNREDSWRRMNTLAGQWTMLGYGYWAVIQRSDGQLVGQCGFGDFERDMAPDIRGLPEMGWLFDPSVHGQGIAFESCCAALAWIDDELGVPETAAIIDPDNAPSIRLAGRLGFERRPDGVYRGAATAVFRRLAG